MARPGESAVVNRGAKFKARKARHDAEREANRERDRKRALSRALLTPLERTRILDARLGVGVGAKKERAKIARRT